MHSFAGTCLKAEPFFLSYSVFLSLFGTLFSTFLLLVATLPTLGFAETLAFELIESMETGISTASGTVTCLGRRGLLDSKPISKSSSCLVLASPRTQLWRWCSTYNKKQSRSTRLVSLVKKTENTVHVSNEITPRTTDESETQMIIPKVAERLARKKSERYTYLVAAIMSSLGVTSAAIMAVYYRFSWQMEVNSHAIL